MMRIALGLALALFPYAAAAQPVTTPSQHLGRPLGADFELADWAEVSSYFTKLAQESPCVQTTQIGTSTEGREFLLSVISSPENLADLEQIKARAAVIADPRGHAENELADAVANGKVILLVSCALHATETAAPQLAMEFAHELATSDQEPWRSARQEIVVALFPTLNPDGLDHVVQWYRETVGTPYEASNLLKLYQYYAGHNNNRDWFMLTQAETRIVTEQLYSVWHPQVYWDIHQQGSRRERFFVPPFRDPLNPNLDPAIISGIDALGSRALLDMTSQGFSGISTGVSYDMWWNGGNRNVPVRHNIIGLLTEAASVRVATPVFLPRSELAGPRGLGEYGPSNRFPDPWPGGWWRLRNIIDYEMAFGRSLLGSLSRERTYWLHNALETSRRVIDRGRDGAPRAWIIPSDNRDPAAVRRIAEVLLLGGIELHTSAGEIQADGRTYPAGSIVIRRDQPYGSHVKDLFEVQRYPEGPPPYDVAGWTLPLLLGIRRVEVMQDLEADALTRVASAQDAIEAFAGDPRVVPDPTGLLTSWSSLTWTALSQRLQGNETLTFLGTGDRAGLFAPGPVIPDEGADALVLREVPRIGVYSPWEGNMDEGWMRYVLDTFRIPYVTVRNEMLRAGELGDFLDVLIIPHARARTLDEGRAPGSVPDQFAGGLAPEGAIAVEEFVRRGGTLITLGSSCRWAADLLRLPVVDVTAEPDAEEFSCPGSVLRAIAADGHLTTAGLPASLAVFFSWGSSAWRPMTDDERREAGLNGDQSVETLLRYAPTRVLLSGWINRPDILEDHAAWLRARHGKGTAHLFAFRPQFRGWAQGTFHLLFRAIFLNEPGDEDA
ncbi:MAG: M14 family metallopeptidase [Planctomycetota bacterium]|jgi:hypothetical protein